LSLLNIVGSDSFTYAIPQQYLYRVLQNLNLQCTVGTQNTIQWLHGECNASLHVRLWLL